MGRREMEHISKILAEEDISVFTSYEAEVFSQIENCQNCSLCITYCPVFKATSQFYPGPRGIADELSRNVREFWQTKDVVYMCTLCGRCQEVCPKNVPVSEAVKLIRAKIFVQRQNLVPEQLRRLLDNISRYGYIFEPMDREERVESVRGRLERLGLPYIEDAPLDGSKGKVAYFPGCQAETRLLEVKEAGKLVLAKFNVDYGIPEGWKCCGLPVRLIGDGATADTLQKEFFRGMKDADVSEIVVTCAGCASELKNAAKRLRQQITVRHIVEYLFEEVGIEAIREKATHGGKVRVTLHEPCHLSRHVGRYVIEYAEEILKALPNVEYVGMEGADECCGAGGLLKFHFPSIAGKIRSEKLKKILEAEVDFVVTPCPLCVVNISEGVARKKIRISVDDLTVFLARRLYAG